VSIALVREATIPFSSIGPNDIGGVLYARDLPHSAGYVSACFVAVALVMVILTKRLQIITRSA
jgi:hypothetical protein